ncbi:hypothetical protein OG598_12145 [Micromonospora sp. NBC_00330]|uniref:hypothetical protein n=1 Tax=Micromonospora sp. NBC_00330 TaxID=2903585 RepID=UPI002E2899C2|nr:hypothetical protein [Micromonospora sp. NBC_00330]
MTAVLQDPAAAADHLLCRADVFGVAQAAGLTTALGGARLELTLLPLPALAADGYPVERIRLVILPPGDQVYAYPRSGSDRPFKHRNLQLGDLCLQYDRDDPALRWLPEDGLEPLVTLVHRHLIFEEAWRRSGDWPCEDAPHGDDRHAPHRIATTAMRKEIGRWSRT